MDTIISVARSTAFKEQWIFEITYIYFLARLTPNYFLSGWEWGAKEDEMNRSWKMRVRLNDSFTKRCSDCGEECKGHFRASQTACSLSKKMVPAHTNTHTYTLVRVLARFFTSGYKEFSH